MNLSDRELLKLNMVRSRRGYEAFLILVAVLECLMMVYGVVYFDFQLLKRKLYFACYVLLFCCTIAALTINRFCLKSGRHDGLLLGNIYVYSGILIFWSAVISALDMGGGGYPVTYMTIMAATGSMMPMSPVVYGCMGVLSSAVLVALALRMHAVGLQLPFYLNFFIFLVVILAVEARNYRGTRKQYLLAQQLEKQAEIDGLTQIPNRRCLDRYIAQLIEEGTAFTFVLLDVDDFKSINDTYGHVEGDLSLTRISKTLTGFFGQWVYRYGGDEFAVISLEDAPAVAEKISRVNDLLNRECSAYPLHTCAGVYRRQPQDDERQVFERADSALYDAKHSGKARAVIYGQPQVLPSSHQK